MQDVPARLLVAIDFSEGSARAGEVAIDLAARWGAEVEWLHALELPSPVLPPSSEALLTSYVEAERRQARDELRACHERAAEAGVKGETHLVNGHPDVVAARLAEDLDVDWVVVGTQGRGAVQSMLVGSVAQKIVRGCRRSILSVRPGPSLAAAEGSGPTIVFGDDLSEEAARPREVAASLARSLGGRLVIVHAVDLGAGRLRSSYGIPPQLADEAREEARRRLAAVAAPLGDHVETLVSVEPAADAVAGVARHQEAALVVTGTSSRTGLARWMLGSVAERVLRQAPCSVLTVKPRPEAEAA